MCPVWAIMIGRRKKVVFISLMKAFDKYQGVLWIGFPTWERYLL